MTRDELLKFGDNRAFDRLHGLTDWDAEEMTRRGAFIWTRSI